MKGAPTPKAPQNQKPEKQGIPAPQLSMFATDFGVRRVEAMGQLLIETVWIAGNFGAAIRFPTGEVAEHIIEAITQANKPKPDIAIASEEDMKAAARVADILGGKS